MRNHIAVKFVAIALAALALLTAVSSAAGVICLTSLDLYDRSVAEYQEEQYEGQRREFAVNLAHRYASLRLGGLPEAFLEEYYGSYWYYNTFTYGLFYYTVRNENGEIVETTLEEPVEDAKYYQISVTDIRYRRVVHDLPAGGVVEETAPETLPPETLSEYPASTQEETVGDENETGSAAQADAAALMMDGQEDAVYSDWYYDYSQDKAVELRWQYAQLPPYTVELYLLPGAMPDAHIWTMLQMLWEVRDYLFYALGAGLLLFAIAMVYLCCAAGRRPGTEEVRAAGLNRIPLDLYFAAAAMLILFAVFILASLAQSLLENHIQVLLPCLGLGGYGCALLVVGFLFAVAAQFKTPGGFWWRGSLTARCLRLGWLILKKICRFLRWLLTHFPAGIKMIFSAVFGGLGKCIRWIAGKIAWLYGLLPLMWQWLLGGGVVLILCILAWANRRDGWCLVWLTAALGLVVYGGCSFGILLKGVKHMSQGDLDSKVDDRLLLGSFKEFAGDLNALSEVAVTAAQKQMKAERMKTELITNVSHDIKTPLTSIINFVDLMEKPHTPEEQAEYLEVLSRQSQRLKKLIDDLMEMSKASSGNLSVEIGSMNAAETVNQALGEFADKLDRAELTPVFRAPETPVTMLADGKLTWRVLSNLLGNAVKYAMPGTRLYLDLTQLDGKVIISLKNISRDPLNVTADELLERFVRGDSSRNTEGSGLGLNIAQSLMELQKGQLRLLVDGDLFKVTLIFPKG